MSHYAIVVPPLFSHIRTLEVLAAALSQRGHRLTFILPEDAVTPGLHNIHACPSLPAAILTAQRRMQNPARRAIWRIARTMAALTEALCRELPALLRTLKVDGVIVDQMEPAGSLVSESLGLPFVSVACALPINREPHLPLSVMPFAYAEDERAQRLYRGSERVYDLIMRPLYRAIRAQSLRLGLTPRDRPDQCLSPLAQIAQWSRSLDFPRHALPECFHYIGAMKQPEKPGAPARAVREQGAAALGYASLGTLQEHPYRLLRKMAAACRRAGVQVMVTHCDRLSEDEVASLYHHGATWVESFIDQPEFIRRADVVVSHAGLNTVLETVAAARPLLLLPVAFDQPAIAARIVHHGLGLRVSRFASSRTLARHITALLNDGRFRCRLEVACQQVSEGGGATRGAAIIEQALASKRPVLRDTDY